MPVDGHAQTEPVAAQAPARSARLADEVGGGSGLVARFGGASLGVTARRAHPLRRGGRRSNQRRASSL